MAKNTQPIAKRCRALGISPAVMGYGKKTTNRNPGGQMRKKKSEYATQLNEKQKVKFVYGILEAPVVLLPSWLERDKNALKGTVTKLPVREDIDVPIAEHLIVELYSK